MTKIRLFDGWAVNDFLAVGSAHRAQTGFGFISRCLDEYPQGTLREEAISAPYSRQIDVLVSYNFELILDAGIFASSSKNTEQELILETKTGHNLAILWDKMPRDMRNFLSIKSITHNKKGIFESYKIKLDNDEILIVEDLNSIRYDIKDFRGKETTHLRELSRGDGSKYEKTIEISKELSKKLLESLYSKYK